MKPSLVAEKADANALANAIVFRYDSLDKGMGNVSGFCCAGGDGEIGSAPKIIQK